MTTIVEALNRIARECSVKAPSSWVTATRTEHLELRDDFLSQTVSDIQDRLDLPSPIGAQTVITGDDSEAYALPTDFVRTQRDEYSVYDANLDRPCIAVPNDGDWSYIKDQGLAGLIRYCRITGYPENYSISFYNPPSASVSITVSYVSDKWMANAGTAGNIFTAEDDVLILPRRVIETGTVWRFRERRGLPYMDKYNEYELLIERLSNDSNTRRKVSFGDKESVRWQDLVPPFIPAS